MRQLTYLLVFGAWLWACKEPFESPVQSPATGYLVVEGVINSGVGETKIILSRTAGLDSREVLFETDAVVKVTSETGEVVGNLSEKTDGQYITNSLALDASQTYRLNMTTKDGKVYESDLLNVNNNPPIDSVYWFQDIEGVNISVATHDPTKSTEYYRWEFTETWEDFAEYRSFLDIKVTNAGSQQVSYEAVYRDSTSDQFFDRNMYFCWREQASTQLLVATTAQLSEDKIDFPLLVISNSTERLKQVFSINVRQMGISKEAYAFYEIMKKNTELTGSIFDGQPAVLYGNIHNISDDKEPVIGYVTISPIQEKRIFIRRTDVEDWRYFSGCELTEIPNNSNAIRESVINKSLLPTRIVFTNAIFPNIDAFNVAKPSCVDCRLNGGTNEKPAYWPAVIDYEDTSTTN
jgi:hypothetical protein